MTSRLLASLLLSTLAAATAAGCSGPPRPVPATSASVSARAATCTGARYSFGRPATVGRLLSVSSAHRLAAGQSMSDADEHQLRALRATAASTAGPEDAAAAYRAYAAILADRGEPLPAFNTITSTHGGDTVTVSAPGRFLTLHIAWVDTVAFTRSCTHGAPANGTVTAWHEGIGGVTLQCGYSPRTLTAAMREAQHLACDPDGRAAG